MCDKYRTCATSINWSEPRALRHTPAQPPDEKARGRRRPKIVDALARRDHVRIPIDGRVPLHMSTLADVFREFNELKATGLVRNYAIGGATAALFYAEPARTYDIDVFVLLGPDAQRPLVSLEPFYQWARTRGFGVDAEHILVHGVPVQFLPAHNTLVEAAVNTARTLDYDDVSVRVIDPEHLVALALQAGGHKRRERAWQLLEAGVVNREALRALLAAHGMTMVTDDEA